MNPNCRMLEERIYTSEEYYPEYDPVEIRLPMCHLKMATIGATYGGWTKSPPESIGKAICCDRKCPMRRY